MADGFEEIEALTPYDYLKRCCKNSKKDDVFLISTNDSENVIGSHGLKIKADNILKDVDLNIKKSDIIILPGGLKGTENLSTNELVLNHIKKAFSIASIAAICAAPSILGNMGLLENIKACCYPGFERYLNGATIVTDKDVVVDKNIITAKGAGVSQQFAFAIVKYLYDDECCKNLKDAVQWKI